MVKMTICYYWFRYQLRTTEQMPSYCLNQWWWSLLTHICVTRSQHKIKIRELRDTIMSSLGATDVVRWHYVSFMMTSSNGNIFRVTGPLCGEFTGQRWIPLTEASDAEHWCFLWSGWSNNREAGDLRRHHAFCDVIVMSQRLVYEALV